MRDCPLRMGDDLESESVVTARCGTSGCRDGMLRRCRRLGARRARMVGPWLTTPACRAGRDAGVTLPGHA